MLISLPWKMKCWFVFSSYVDKTYNVWFFVSCFRLLCISTLSTHFPTQHVFFPLTKENEVYQNTYRWSKTSNTTKPRLHPSFTQPNCSHDTLHATNKYAFHNEKIWRQCRKSVGLICFLNPNTAAIEYVLTFHLLLIIVIFYIVIFLIFIFFIFIFFIVIG